MSRQILVMLSADPEGRGDQLRDCSVEHVREMIAVPEIQSAEAFRIVEPPARGFPRPPYMDLCLYEWTAGAFGSMEQPGRDWRPDPPGGLGPNRPDGFVFESVPPLYRRTDHVSA